MADTAKIEQMFLEHAGFIRNDVAKNLLTSDFYIENLNKTPWLDGQGEVYSYPVYERVLPSEPVVFRAAASSTGDGNTATADGTEGGQCSLAGVNITSFGVDKRQVQLKEAAVNSPDVCLKDLRYAWQLQDQIKNVTRALSQVSRYVWSQEYQDAYVNAVSNKIVFDDNVADQIGNETFDAVAPTYQLSWELLEFLYAELGYVGADENPSGRDEEGNPVYALVGDWQDFHKLKLLDGNFRADNQSFAEGARLINGPVGLPAGKSYRGFQFKTVKFPPRYDIVDGVLTRREPYIALNDVSKGVRFEPNPLYKSARYTVTTVFHKDVMDIVIPGVQSTGAMAFNPQYSWTGEFVWRNIPDRNTNPDGNIGWFRALFAYGPKVQLPERGMAILHERCTTTVRGLTCGLSA